MADGGRRTGWSAGEEGHLDIDPVLRPLVKSFVSVTKLRALSGAVDEALTTVTAFSEMVSSRGTLEGDADVLGDGVAVCGVSKYPARVKCALLGWLAFKDALARASHQLEDR